MVLCVRNGNIQLLGESSNFHEVFEQNSWGNLHSTLLKMICLLNSLHSLCKQQCNMNAKSAVLATRFVTGYKYYFCRTFLLKILDGLILSRSIHVLQFRRTVEQGCAVDQWPLPRRWSTPVLSSSSVTVEDLGKADCSVAIPFG